MLASSRLLLRSTAVSFVRINVRRNLGASTVALRAAVTDPTQIEVKTNSIKNKQLILEKHPIGEIKDDDLQVHRIDLDCMLKDGEVLVRTELISLDPTHRVWMSGKDSYLPAVKLGDVMRAGCVGHVVKSKDPKLPVGTLVGGMSGVQEYFIPQTADRRMFSGVSPLPDSLPHSNFLSVFAPHIGGTAYTGTVDICGKNVGPGKTFVVSGASGAVGSLAGQLAKIRGAKVVGVVGSKEKEGRCLEDYRFDGVINYKTDDIAAKLKELAPNGVDAYFDNTGGDVSTEVFGQLNIYAKIAQCGLVSQYNSDERELQQKNYGMVVMKRLNIQGFVAGDKGPEGTWETMETIGPKLGKYLQEGRLKFDEDIQEGGVENYLNSLRRLFTGANKGKLILKMY